ncbi:MAG TPA: TIGR03435 family protein, partial [Terracidiphilus sp.]|nr:TIGR03435 family protein [Terracidiphilus sp.]
MLKRLPTLAVAGLLVAGSFASARAAAQTTPQSKTSFDVASIRPAVIDLPGGEGSTRSQIQTAPDGLTLRNIDLDEMIEWAYTLQHNQLANPGTLHNHRYDVRARAA